MGIVPQQIHTRSCQRSIPDLPRAATFCYFLEGKGLLWERVRWWSARSHCSTFSPQINYDLTRSRTKLGNVPHAFPAALVSSDPRRSSTGSMTAAPSPLLHVAAVLAHGDALRGSTSTAICTRSGLIRMGQQIAADQRELVSLSNAPVWITMDEGYRSSGGSARFLARVAARIHRRSAPASCPPVKTRPAGARPRANRAISSELLAFQRPASVP